MAMTSRYRSRSRVCRLSNFHSAGSRKVNTPIQKMVKWVFCPSNARLPTEWAYDTIAAPKTNVSQTKFIDQPPLVRGWPGSVSSGD